MLLVVAVTYILLERKYIVTAMFPFKIFQSGEEKIQRPARQRGSREKRI